MAKGYDDRNTGVLFKNDKKGNDKAPDYTGSFTNENNEKMDLAAWIRDGKKGKFLSVKVSEKFQPKGGNGGGGRGRQEDDDDVPF